MKLIDSSRTWFVARSKVRQEDRAYKAIQRAGFDVYLPIMKVEKKHRRTNTYSVIEKPLMTGYLFVGFASFAKHFEMVRKCDGVLDFLKGMDGPLPFPTKDVIEIQCAEIDMRFDNTRAARIHRGEEEKTRKLTIRKQFAKGSDVMVSDSKSPFADIHAVVEDVTNSGNVRVLMDLFGRMVAAEFQANQLKPAA